jgi:hypothetical protein
MKILVCGGRTFGDTRPELIAFVKAMLKLHKKHGVEFTLVHGDADGADTLARAWAELLRLEQRPYPVTDEEWARLGKKAGPLRNQRMLDEERPDAVVAFPGNRGTADMVSRARAVGVPIWIPYPNASAFS